MTQEDTVTWILVAARSGAALYEHSPEQGLRRLDEIPAPSWADLADPARPASSDVTQLRFTLELAELLERGVSSGVGALILMAESKMLGAIRRHLSRGTARRIHASLNVAQPDWDEASLAARLAPLLAPNRSSKRSADFF